MAGLLLKNARAVVTMDDEGCILRNCSILATDGRIVAMGPEESVQPAAGTPPGEVIDASEMLVYPGLVNTHHHLYQILTRNLPAVQRMELFQWLRTLYELWRGLTPEMVYASSLAGFGELLRSGCTTCLDHHYVFPRGRDPHLIDMQVAATTEIGIRFHACRGSMSLGRRDGGLPPDDLVQSVDEILKDSLRLIETYHDPSPLAMTRLVLAPCSPFSVSADLMMESAALARSKGVRLHTHLAETKDEETYCLERMGRRPLEYMEELGWLGPDVWFAHGIHFTGQEVTRLAATGTGVAHCPVSNQKLASGVAPVPQMLRAGVPVGLAVDGSASNDGSNLLGEIRAAYLMHRLYWGGDAPGPADVLRLATRGGARLLGRDDIGSLEVGKAADMFLIDSRRLELAGALADVAGLPATTGINPPVDVTIVNGRVVVRDGRLVGVDERVLAARVNELTRAMTGE